MEFVQGRLTEDQLKMIVAQAMMLKAEDDGAPIPDFIEFSIVFRPTERPKRRAPPAGLEDALAEFGGEFPSFIERGGVSTIHNGNGRRAPLFVAEDLPEDLLPDETELPEGLEHNPNPTPPPPEDDDDEGDCLGCEMDGDFRVALAGGSRN